MTGDERERERSKDLFFRSSFFSLGKPAPGDPSDARMSQDQGKQTRTAELPLTASLLRSRAGEPSEPQEKEKERERDSACRASEARLRRRRRRRSVGRLPVRHTRAAARER